MRLRQTGTFSVFLLLQFFDPTPYRGIWRASRLRQLLQSHPNAPVFEQGLAGVARHRVIRLHIACANSGRIAPPIRQDLVSDRDRWIV